MQQFSRGVQSNRKGQHFRSKKMCIWGKLQVCAYLESENVIFFLWLVFIRTRLLQSGNVFFSTTIFFQHTHKTEPIKLSCFLYAFLESINIIISFDHNHQQQIMFFCFQLTLVRIYLLFI
jgi:hypothetical protein